MKAATSLMVRVRHVARSGSFEATTMVVGPGRQSAKSTHPFNALRLAAAKGLAVPEDQVTLKPLKGDDLAAALVAVGSEWQAFDATVKGSTTQLDLLPASKGARHE